MLDRPLPGSEHMLETHLAGNVTVNVEARGVGLGDERVVSDGGEPCVRLDRRQAQLTMQLHELRDVGGVLHHFRERKYGRSAVGQQALDVHGRP